VNYLGSGFPTIEQGIPDNQEMVDYVEAQMQTLEQTSAGFLLFEANLSKSTGANPSDVLKQPALVNAVTNRWGGDTEFFAQCSKPARPPDVLFHEDFEPSNCPLEKQDSLIPNPGWEVILDDDASRNHVLRGTQQTVLPNVPTIGRFLWKNYAITLRIRLVGGPAPPAGAVTFRNGIGGDHYSLNFGFNQLLLAKNLNTQGQNLTLGSFAVPEGLQVGRWYQLEISAAGSSLTVKLDGTQVIQVSDSSTPLLSGGVGFYVGSGVGPATVDFDDITISALSNTPTRFRQD
jgi:hypothetical protein